MALPSRLMGSGMGPQAANNIVGDAANAVTAAGTTATDATLLSAVNNNVSTTASGTGVKLMPTETGALVYVRNSGASTLLVYPATGSTINGAASLSVPTGVTVALFATSGTAWRAMEGAPAGVTASAAELNITDGLLASTAELNRAADVSTRIVNCTASSLVVTEADHDGKTIVLDRAAGIAVTLPAAAAGLKFRFIVKTTFTSAASIKSVSGADVMIGYALMGNDSDNTVVRWPSVAGDTADTIDLLGTSNSTGGMAGQEIDIEGLAANLWFVKIVGDAGGTEATPFTNTVA
jgi:hypothetical protein